MMVAERHGMWKGDKVGYQGIHAWIRRYYSHLKTKCDECGTVSRLQFAKKEGADYTRDINDYRIMCISCHLRYDKFGKPTTKRGKIFKREKSCELCNVMFVPAKPQRRFCGNSCSMKFKMSNIELQKKDVPTLTS